MVVTDVKAMGNGGLFKMFHVKHLSELIESYFSKMFFSIKRLKSLIILSAYAEDHGLCPWMNADFVAKSFLCPWVNATADSATGRRRVFHGGTTDSARGAPLYSISPGRTA